MNALRQEAISVEEYLAGEQAGDVRHEYVGGSVYAMAGASEDHGLVVGNCFALLHSHLKGRGCKVFVADMKLRLKLYEEDVFYYPDLLVTCDARDSHRFYKEMPSLLIEVTSETTERVDRREKFWSYSQIESLEEYVLFAQDRQEATVFRRTTGWKPEVFRGGNETVPLRSVGLDVKLSSIYDGIAVNG